ncbi:class I tRNA ligase family protein [Candidatus Dependentiae bacterium]|nr:class I tRNA ligase family protein [Candidatus Dependentiae bacterium]
MKAFKTNTAVSALMEFLNDLSSEKHKLDKEILEHFLVTISAMVPHFSSELLERLLNKKLRDGYWQTYNPKLAQVDNVEIAIQVNGKLRGTLNISKDTSRDKVELESKKIIEKWLVDKVIIKVIYVPNRLINFVIK